MTIEEIRERVAALRRALLSSEPGCWEQHLAALRMAPVGLSLLTSPERSDLEQLKQITQDLRACRALSEQGIASSKILFGIVSAPGGYSQAGSAAPLNVPSTLFVEG